MDLHISCLKIPLSFIILSMFQSIINYTKHHKKYLKEMQIIILLRKVLWTPKKRTEESKEARTVLLRKVCDDINIC